MFRNRTIKLTKLTFICYVVHFEKLYFYNNMEAKQNIQKDLDHFTGSEQFYRDPLSKSIYTEGISYVAKNCQAYWLLDLVFSSVRFKMPNEEFISIKLKVDTENSKGKIIFDDGNNNVLYEQEIPYTDFPLEELKMFYCNNTLMLTSEY